jgi:hypothetical protein
VAASPGSTPRTSGRCFRRRYNAEDTKENSMNLVLFILIGLIAGALAGRVVSGHGYGVLGDIVVGLSAPSWESGSLPRF